MSNEKISSTTTSNYNQAPKPVYDNARIKLSFITNLLKKDKVTYNHGPMVNIYIFYRLVSDINNSRVTLENYLFGAVKLTKNADIDKYKYSGYGIGFDSRGNFTHPSGGYGKNVIIFGADMSSSVHFDNKKKYILILGKGLTQVLGGTTLTPEKLYSINFTVANKTFCLSLHCNADNSYLFVNGKEIINFKAKDSEIVPYPLFSRKYFKRL